MERLFAEVELPLVPILARMEANGVALDRAALTELDAEFKAEIQRLERAIFDAVGHEFTIGSPKQLGDILFVELGLPKGSRTKTGYSTDAAVLEELGGVHPGHRPHPRVADLHEAPLDLRGGAADPARRPDDRLHTTFHQAVAATGRLSSSDPNLQNIPIRSDLGRRIRRAFVSGEPATVLLAADYSQIELRILAHVSGDVHLQDAFAREADIHRETAARVLHKDPLDVTADERSMAKMVNFGLAYGMSDFGLSSRGRDQPPGSAGVHQLVLRGVLRDQLLHDGHQGDAPRRTARSRRCSVASGASRSSSRRTARCAGRGSGWPSTCPSRARPRTS